MGTAFALVVLLDAYDAVAEKIQLPDEAVLREWAGKGEAHKKIVAILTDRKGWAKAFETIHEKLGIFLPAVEVRVIIEETDDKRPACSIGSGGKGIIRFNMRQLVPYQKKLDEIEEQKKNGKTIRWVVPPSRLDASLTHELTHVVCGSPEDLWLAEGMASYAAGDDAALYDFNRRGARVDTLDRVVPEADAYARGLAFFRWLESEFGQEKIRAFAQRMSKEHEKPSALVADVVGKPWERLVLREKIWSAEYIAKFKNTP